MTTKILPETEINPYPNMSTRTLVAVLVLMWERGERRPDIIARTIEPVRAELHRREVAGWDDPFHPIHDPVQPS